MKMTLCNKNETYIGKSIVEQIQLKYKNLQEEDVKEIKLPSK